MSACCLWLYAALYSLTEAGLLASPRQHNICLDKYQKLGFSTGATRAPGHDSSYALRARYSLAMSGSVKLKIKLKPRPAEGQSIPDSSGHKRKLDDSARDPPGNKGLGASSTSEIHKHKKLKQAQASSGTPGAVPQSNKVKLHIKGPWGKATSTSGNNDSPLRSSSSVVQPSSAQHRGSVVAGSKPPAKQAPDTGRQTHILSAKPPSKKKRQHSFTASGFQPHTANGAASFAKHGTQSLDTKSEDTNMESVSGRPGTTLGHAVKADEAITSAEGIQPTRAVLERIVDKMQRKDTFNIFKEPVTEAMVRCLQIRLRSSFQLTNITLRKRVAGAWLLSSSQARHGFFYDALKGSGKWLQCLAGFSGVHTWGVLLYAMHFLTVLVLDTQCKAVSAYG